MFSKQIRRKGTLRGISIGHKGITEQHESFIEVFLQKKEGPSDDSIKLISGWVGALQGVHLERTGLEIEVDTTDYIVWNVVQHTPTGTRATMRARID